MKTLEALKLYLGTHTLSPQTVLNYTKVMKHLSQFSEELPINKLQIDSFFVWLSDTIHLQDTTRRQYRQFLSCLYRYLDDSSYPNPIPKTRKIKVQKLKYKFHTPSEMGRLISVCATDFEKCLILTLLDSDCRVGELGYEPTDPQRHPGLKGKDVDINCIHTIGKTGQHDYRLAPNICHALKDLAKGNDNYVFCAHTRGGMEIPDKPATSDALSLRVRYLMKKANIQGHIGPHSIRHFSASLVAKESDSALVAKALLGHANEKTSYIYLDDVEDAIRQKYSPMKILADKLFQSSDHSVKQSNLLDMPNQSTDVMVIEDKPSLMDTMTEESYVLIPDNLPTIHTGLTAQDLQLIRRAFIELSLHGKVLNDPAESRKLWRRILRRTSL